MKEKLKKLGIETILGGIFGIISIVAIVIEMSLGGFSAEAIAGGVKDIAGTMVAVMVFLIAIKHLLPSKANELPFKNRMENSLEAWISAHSNMIVRTSKLPKGHENDYGMSMTTDMNRFYNNDTLKSDSGTGVGRFLRLAEISEAAYAEAGVSIDFFLNAQTYCYSDDPDDSPKELVNVGKNIASYMNGSFNGITVSEPKKIDVRTVVITVSFKNPIITNKGDRIDLVIGVIDRMYQAMLVSARRKQAL